ncbi:4-hydroxy-tetrahydrodipicolinate synthase [Simkania sp.]|uniref:4-hydroxy-tetrahydrodipicolinate synthase n=1 Tax=Simkania sp. TaxID=34094 RepID=UPI003B52C90F
MRLEGVITSLITPFKNQTLDVEGLKENIRFQLENGVSGILVGGTTGEAPTLDMDEYEMLIRTAAELIQKKVPLLVSIGESATKRSLIKMEMATDLGADALLVATPAYNKPSQEGLYQHFKAIAGSSKIPLILYNNPSRTGVSIELSTLLRLVEIDNIIGIKESSGSIQVAQEMLYHIPSDFIFLSGEDNLTLPLIALGARGVVSVLSNLKPQEMVSFVETALKGDFSKAREKQHVLYPFFQACFCETNPVPIKTMMALLGKAAGHCRLPLAPLKNENIERLQTLLKLSQTKAHHG